MLSVSIPRTSSSRGRGSAVLILLLSLLLGGRAFGQDPVVILHWNDFHGQVYPMRFSSGEVGGIRAISAVVRAEAATVGEENLLVLDAGDWYQGTPEGMLPEGRMIIDLFNALGVDATTIGNHDFDLGVDTLRSLIEAAGFPVLGGNILLPDRSGPVDYALPHVIIERGGIRFGIVGVVTEETKRILMTEIAQGLEFEDPVPVVRRSVEALRAEGAECLIVLSHLGEEGDVRLATEVEGIDLILGGHSHTRIDPRIDPTHGTVIAQASSNGALVGRLEVRRDGDGVSITGVMMEMEGRSAPVDPDIEEILARYAPDVESVMGDVVGELPVFLDRPPRTRPAPTDAERATAREGGLPEPVEDRTAWHIRSDPLTTWLAAVMADEAGVRIGLHNRGGVRASLPEGTITRRDLFQVSPFGNTVVQADVTGSQLRAMVQTALARPERRFDVVGLEIGWTHGETFGPAKKLVSLRSDGIDIDDEAIYTIATNNYLASGGDGWGEIFTRSYRETGSDLYEASVEAIRALSGEEGRRRLDAAVGAQQYRQVGGVGERATSLFGLVALLGLAWLLSTNRKRMQVRVVAWGIGLQAILAALILLTTPGRALFDVAKGAFQKVLDFSTQGAAFVWGPLADVPASGFIFAVQISATIILVGALTAILYHIGIMQILVWLLAKVMQLTMRTSGAESLAAAANVFVGQTEAPLVVRPYLARFTASETMCLMTGGMATVAGGVLAAYVGMGIDAGHLLAASVMSAPAALAIAKIMVPETETSATAAHVPFEVNRTDANVLDAACRGASEGLKLSLNVMAMIIAFIALIALLNFGIGEISKWFLPAEVLADEALLAQRIWSIERLLGYLFAPFAWLLGIHPAETFSIGSLLGIKLSLNEFLAYDGLAQARGTLSPRSEMLATYALCGFANFSSIAIQIGGISALEGGLRPTLAKYGFRAMIGGTLAAMSTACVVGVLS